MTDQVTIANLALAAIGTRSNISSLTEGSNESNALNLQYGPALDAALRGAHWNFARKQLSLALLKDATQGQIVPTPWVYEYAYPADCVLARALMPVVQSPAGTMMVAVPQFVGPAPRFLISSDTDINGNDINVVLTNLPQAILIYTKRITNTALFDAEFVEAFAAVLGAKVCMTLTGDKQLANLSIQNAQMMLMMAQARNGNEGLTILDTTPDWMRVRGYASDWAYPDGGGFSYGPQALSLIS